jgi:hypothetical protein
MVLHEFRIPLPMTVEEFHRGQLYMTAQASLEASEGEETAVASCLRPSTSKEGVRTTLPRRHGRGSSFQRANQRKNICGGVADARDAGSARKHVTTALQNGRALTTLP